MLRSLLLAFAALATLTSAKPPPQAALDACSSLQQGSACSFSCKTGTVSGTCQLRNAQLVCKKPPPQAAIDACSSLAQDAACSFTGDKGQVSGSCKLRDGQLACKGQRDDSDKPWQGKGKGRKRNALDDDLRMLSTNGAAPADGVTEPQSECLNKCDDTTNSTIAYLCSEATCDALVKIYPCDEYYAPGRIFQGWCDKQCGYGACASTHDNHGKGGGTEAWLKRHWWVFVAAAVCMLLLIAGLVRCFCCAKRSQEASNSQHEESLLESSSTKPESKLDHSVEYNPSHPDARLVGTQGADQV